MAEQRQPISFSFLLSALNFSNNFLPSKIAAQKK
jgi:hypothetical protein